MRKIICVVAFFAVVFACAGMVMAQPGGGGRGQGPGGPGGPGMGRGMMMGPGMGMGGPGGGMMALFSEEGRKDIGLSEEQGRQIGEIMRGGMEGVQFPDRGASEADREAFRASMEKRMQESTKKVKAVFTADQLKKVQTRTLQAGGYGSLAMSPFAQEALGVSEDQVKKIREAQQKAMEGVRPPENIREMTEEQRREFFQGMRTRMEEAQKKAEESIKAVLTDEQKAKAEGIIKDTPEYIKEAQSRRPGGPGGPQGGEGGGRGYTPGADSWRPGQGAGGAEGRREGTQRRSGGFPSGGNRNN